MADAGGDAPLLAPLDQVVDQDAELAGRPGSELVDGRAEVVDPVEALHDYALDPQVVAPHPFDQFGVVDTLHPETPGPGHPGR